MQRFDYIAPRTIREAVAALGSRRKAVVLAGGTDALMRMKARTWSPELVVDVKRIPRADELRFDRKTGLTIGPAVTMREVELSPVVRRHYQALSQGAELVASVQIRNRATVVGNICNAAPSADTAPGLMVLGAKVRIAGPKGRRSVSVEDFFLGPGQTALKRGELVTGIQVPAPATRTGSAYERHTIRQAMDIAVVGVGVSVTLAPRTGACEDVRIALGAVAPTPIRARSAEGILRGERFTDELIDAAAEAAAAEAKPITDVRSSAEFRCELVRVLTRRMVEAAIGNARARSRAKRRAA